MSQHMPTNGLFGVSVCHCVAWIGHDLVCHIDGDVKLFGQLHDTGQHFAEDLLALG